METERILNGHVYTIPMRNKYTNLKCQTQTGWYGCNTITCKHTFPIAVDMSFWWPRKRWTNAVFLSFPSRRFTCSLVSRCVSAIILSVRFYWYDIGRVSSIIPRVYKGLFTENRLVSVTYYCNSHTHNRFVSLILWYSPYPYQWNPQ
jgi:hypothetical protein